MKRQSGRVYEPELMALAKQSGERITLCAPAVGLWRGMPPVGALVEAGHSLGELEILGFLHHVRVPAGVRGVVVEVHGQDGRAAARRPLGHGDTMVVLAPPAHGVMAADAGMPAKEQAGAASAAGTLVFRAPTSGRYYGKAGPGKPPFVKVGDEIAVGATVCLLEVMKTFNRVTYGGAGLPERARVAAIVPRDEDDLAAGDVILELAELG